MSKLFALSIARLWIWSIIVADGEGTVDLHRRRRRRSSSLPCCWCFFCNEDTDFPQSLVDPKRAVTLMLCWGCQKRNDSLSTKSKWYDYEMNEALLVWYVCVCDYRVLQTKEWYCKEVCAFCVDYNTRALTLCTSLYEYTNKQKIKTVLFSIQNLLFVVVQLFRSSYIIHNMIVSIINVWFDPNQWSILYWRRWIWPYSSIVHNFCFNSQASSKMIYMTRKYNINIMILEK